MAAIVALPKNIELAANETAITLVVPAQNGCNLNCSFCFIKRRNEAPVGANVLTQSDYLSFIHEVASTEDVAIVSLQGYEPLLPESWPISEAILKNTNKMGIRTSVVTNGTFLKYRLPDLLECGVDGVTVSLDSHLKEMHDHTRGTLGAYDATVSGLEAVGLSPLRDKVLVASVLQPGKLSDLIGLPELLNKLNLKQWVVTPQYNVGSRREFAPFVPASQIIQELTFLNKIAQRWGVNLVVDDEFKQLMEEGGGDANYEKLRIRSLAKLDQVIRLAPDGFCSVGLDILSTSGSTDKKWVPGCESAKEFLGRANLLNLVKAGY